jgi:hypothetical protein
MVEPFEIELDHCLDGAGCLRGPRALRPFREQRSVAFVEAREGIAKSVRREDFHAEELPLGVDLEDQRELARVGADVEAPGAGAARFDVANAEEQAIAERCEWLHPVANLARAHQALRGSDRALAVVARARGVVDLFDARSHQDPERRPVGLVGLPIDPGAGLE